MMPLGGEGPVRFYTASGDAVVLDRWYAGASVFLTLAGPALADMNLDLLRGVMTLGVNNSWATFRPRLWTCADPPEKFHWKGWADPAITKVVPSTMANVCLRVRNEKGEWVKSPIRVCDLPAVWFFQRNLRFEPADFLCDRTVNWGMSEKDTDCLGVKGKRSVMLAGLKLAHSLGFRTVYLCGADFRMEPGKANYAFDQQRDRNAIRHNRALYAALTKRFEALKPVFDLEGFTVVNCTPGSALKVFPYLRLSEAVARATEECGGVMDVRGMYDGPPKDEFRYYREHGNGD